MSYRALVIEDEELSRRRLRRLLEAHPEIEVVGEAASGPEAVAQIEQHRPGLVFMDIDLPEFGGFEVLKRCGAVVPLVIFTTGHDQYALQAFEAAGIDYLLKPIEPETLARALSRLERLSGNRAELDRQFSELLKHWKPPAEPRYLHKMAVRLGERAVLIELREVTYFEAKDKYVFMHTTAGKEYIVDYTVADLEQQLDPQKFVRVHRSTILNIDHVKEIHNWFGGKYRVILGDKGVSELVVSKGMAANLKAIIPF